MSIVELHSELTGPHGGAPLVLGSSLGTSLAMWDPQLPELSRRWRVVRFDHRGHGGSPAPTGPYTLAELGGDVLALADRLGLRSFSYCGLSLGGMVGMWLAINAPQRIDRLVLISTSSHLPPASAWRERADAVRSAGTVAAVADSVLKRWFTEPFAREHPQIVAHHREMLVGTPAEGYAGCCEAIAELDLRDGLPAIDAPALVIVGEQDPATPPVHAETIAAAVPEARLEVLDPGAHLASVERAADVTALITGHLSRP
ncbi:MAG: 3-oxoadipate enol-lactonase [Solirubrobacterales bacterium]|nr:3-oxoadipate enol-lactonase [Solirubrobacterales bacterium]